jgi:proteasome assembly chaperone (PAC2) family protein
MKALAELPLKLYKKPKLKGPRLVVAWGSIGAVGIETTTYLKDKIKATEFAEIEPYDFFDVSIQVEDGMIQELKFPESKFYYWKNRKGGDIIICIADYEPLQLRYKYTELILDVAQRFEIDRVYTICAFPSPIHHDEEPRVFAVVNNTKLIEDVKQYGAVLLEEKDLDSMNALLLGLAKKRNIQGIYLLGEVPSYTTEIENPKSCKAVIRVLTAMLDLNIDMTEIDETARQAEEEIDKRVKAASWEFIDHFTVDYRDFFNKEKDQE